MFKSPEAGFTVLEALVAIAILGLAGGSLVYANQRAALRSLDALERFRIVLAAETTLARLGLDLPIRPGRQTGATADGITWTLELTPRTPAPRPRGLFDVAIEATGNGSDVVRLSSVVVAP